MRLVLDGSVHLQKCEVVVKSEGVKLAMCYHSPHVALQRFQFFVVDGKVVFAKHHQQGR